ARELFPETGNQLPATLRCVCDQLLLVEDAQRLERRDTGEAVATEGRAVPVEALHRAVGPAVQVAAGERHADRSDAAAERLGQHQNAGFGVRREAGARAALPRL